MCDCTMFIYITFWCKNVITYTMYFHYAIICPLSPRVRTMTWTPNYTDDQQVKGSHQMHSGMYSCMYGLHIWQLTYVHVQPCPQASPDPNYTDDQQGIAHQMICTVEWKVLFMHVDLHTQHVYLTSYMCSLVPRPPQTLNRMQVWGWGNMYM